MNIIKSENLKKYFGNVKAVDDVSFSVEKGELFGFLGVNGAGKSTVINMLATLLEPTDGNVTVCGHALGKENELIRRKIGIVWQQNCLDDILTVEENLLCRGSLYEKDARKNRASLDRVTQLLKLDDVLNYIPARISGLLLVAASPLTRSSYHAGDDFAKLRAAREAQLGRSMVPA